jgi:MFS family permease
MTSSNQKTDLPPSCHWRSNLAVYMFGSVTTITAMTLLLPFLPIYVEQLGVHGGAAIAQWSGMAFGASFLVAALVQPLWGRLGDRYGRKLMLLRGSLRMAIAVPITKRALESTVAKRLWVESERLTRVKFGSLSDVA